MSRTDAEAAKVVDEEEMAEVVYEAGRVAPSETELSELLGGLAHELRNPLASVQGCAQTLAERGEDLPVDVRRQMADVIARHAQRMDWLVQAVGSFASPGVPGDDDVDLAALLQEVGASSGVEVQADAELRVRGSEERLRLALETVLNAFGPAADARLVAADRRVDVSAPEIDPASSGRQWKLAAAARMLAIDGGRLEVDRDERGAVARLAFTDTQEEGR